MSRAVTALVLAAGLALAPAAFVSSTAFAQRMPEFDARPGCEAGAGSGVSQRPDVESCLRSEQAARDQLAAEWDRFAAPDRRRCVGRTWMGGPPSYIEVLTCVEIAQSARELPKDDNTGLDAGLRR